MKSLISFLICLLLASCAMAPTNTPKFNGVSFVGTRNPIDIEHVEPLININATHAAVMPFGFMRDKNNPEIIFNSERQWFGETALGVKQYVEMLRTQNIQIMLKPQIWIGRGEFTGHIELETETQWQQFEISYEKFILEYAQLAENLKIKLFCIGTELERFIKNRPEYWNILIKKIKQIYTGKLIYSANWDEYHKTPFWNELDYIGINAYFPLTDEQTPSVESCKTAMQKWKTEMHEFSMTHNKSILFTEFGYRSVDFTAKQPWRFDRDMNVVNLEGQVNATQAFFEMFWNEDWIMGGFIWKWFPNHETAGGIDDSQFSPQNKPVEAVIKANFKN